MREYNTKLMEAILSGGNVDEVFRQEIENAINRLLETAITAFLGYELYSVEGYNSRDSRNRSYTRTIHSRYGDIQVKILRDRHGADESGEELIRPEAAVEAEVEFV